MNRKEEAQLELWTRAWPGALEAWSSFTKIRQPVYCFTKQDEEQEGLSGSFAMIRLRDHRIVISLRQVAELDLDDCALEILAHEIGHHVFVPADLRDNARLMARIRAALGATLGKQYGPMVANLWADLLINDRLQRDGHNLARVYEKIGAEDAQNESKLWTLYLRTYEHLWSLPRGHLATEFQIPIIEGDALLAARLVRSYSREWIDGGGKFAALLFPFLAEANDWGLKDVLVLPWLDSLSAGEGGEMPDGLATIEDGELVAVGHPALDGDLSDDVDVDNQIAGGAQTEVPGASSKGRATLGGKKNRYRPPEEFRELMESLGVQISEKDLVIRYYRELARPHLIRFPAREVSTSSEPIPSGLELWEPGHPIAAIDWIATATGSPVIIPGVTTVQRMEDQSQGSKPEMEPPDLYLGVDCSGSMPNPAHILSYPVLAGTVITLSALRAGARVKTCLSGEPGEFTHNEEYSRDSRKNLGVLTGYLGTGYAFGLQRLVDEFLAKDPPDRPVHILIVTDFDIFSMLNEHFSLREVSIPGWEVAEQALQRARGGGTIVIQGSHTSYYRESIQRLTSLGWSIHFVKDEDELVRFARAFSRTQYEPTPEKAAKARQGKKS